MTFVSLEESLKTKEQFKFVTIIFGDSSLMKTGIAMMLELYAVN